MTQPISTDQALAQSFAPEESLSLAPIQAKPKRRVFKKTEKRFISALSIVTDDGKVFKVPVNQESASAQRQLLASKLLSVFNQNVNFILDNSVPMLPKDLADLAKAGSTISQMNEAAHNNTDGPAPTNGNTAIAQLAHGMMKGAVEGAMGSAMSLEERMAKIQALGRKQQEKIVVSSERIKAKAPEITIEP